MADLTPGLGLVLGTSMMLGTRHALEPDHLMAVSALVTRERSMLASTRVAALWGIGHALTLGTVGGVIVAFRIGMSGNVLLVLELAVAGMLMLLGAGNLMALRTAPSPMAAHAKPVAAGIVHGLSGSAAFALLLLPLIGDPNLAAIFLAVYGAGTIAGMMASSVVLAAPAIYAARRVTSLHRWMQAAAGILSIGGGLYLGLNPGGVQELFGATPPPAVRAAPALLRPVRYDLGLEVDFARERFTGSARVTVMNPHRQPVREASFLLYRLLTVHEVRDPAGNPLPFQQSVTAFDEFTKLQVNHVRIMLPQALASGAETSVAISYGGHLLGYSETGMAYVRERIDSAYTLLREDSHAYPTVGVPSSRVNRAAGLPAFSYRAHVTVPATHVVANGGTLVERTEHGDKATYVYESIRPSWRMDFAIARFGTMRRGDLTVFHLPDDSTGAARILNAMERTLALYTRWFGPLRDDVPFTVVEIPNGWGSQADVTSILQSAAAFRDPTREHELYHELSHMWNVTSTEHPSPRWDEGLATFLENVTLDTLYGRATTDSAAMRMASWLRNRVPTDSLLRTVPPAQFGALEMTGYSYSVGSVMFYSLYRLVGHEAFGRIIGGYYRIHAERGGNTLEFERIARAETPTLDLRGFFDDWLHSTRWTGIVGSASRPEDLWVRYRMRT